MGGERFYIGRDRSTFKNEEKKLKRHYKEKEMLEKIILLIKESSSYDELVINPFSKMYGFEILRYDMSGYYSFNLCKNGGMIRLICRIEKENKYPKSFIIYRLAKDHYIRYDSKIYQQYNILL